QEWEAMRQDTEPGQGGQGTEDNGKEEQPEHEAVHKLKYPDHHKFTPKDARKIKDTFDKIVSVNKIIITTEKDAMRLSTPEIIKIIGHLPIFYWPISVNLHDEDKTTFNQKILNYVRDNTKNG
ncbi:MAG: tetraacyldisaccharide 4'-kinase, partial [Bacteroidales bacterium]